MVEDLRHLISHRPIAELSLAHVHERAKRFEPTLGWTDAHLDHVEALYRCFLFLVWKYPDRAIVPNKEVDLFWHWHILDTRRYTEDCHAVFGRMLHHDPGVSLAGEEELRLRETAFRESSALYAQEFPKLAALNPWDRAEAGISQPSPW